MLIKPDFSFKNLVHNFDDLPMCLIYFCLCLMHRFSMTPMTSFYRWRQIVFNWIEGELSCTKYIVSNTLAFMSDPKKYLIKAMLETLNIYFHFDQEQLY